MKRNCENCEAYDDKRTGYFDGCCRLNPPSIELGNNTNRWPPVDKYYWCLQHKFSEEYLRTIDPNIKEAWEKYQVIVAMVRNDGKI